MSRNIYCLRDRRVMYVMYAMYVHFIVAPWRHSKTVYSQPGLII